jgi:hypothetical protein
MGRVKLTPQFQINKPRSDDPMRLSVDNGARLQTGQVSQQNPKGVVVAAVLTVFIVDAADGDWGGMRATDRDD